MASTLAAAAVANLSNSPITILATTTAPLYTVLDPNCEYWVHHPGVNVSNVADTATVIVATADSLTMTCAEGVNKAALVSGTTIQVGPGASQLHYQSLATAPILCISKTKSDFGLH